MKVFKIKQNSHFIGRKDDLQRMSEIKIHQEARMLIVYGRRRVGKTELLEQFFRDRKVLKFEGIEDAEDSVQIQTVLDTLANYVGDTTISKLQLTEWGSVFELIAKYVRTGTWTLYFEEVQWLANYKPLFASRLKSVWDNYFRRNPKIILILCGSSPSFMINEIVRSKALYNRSQDTIGVRQFTILEAAEFLGKRKSKQEILDAYLTVGGIPEYLKYLKSESSVYLSLCKNSFRTNAFFLEEYEKIFVSSLAKNGNYRKIIEIISKNHFCTREELLQSLSLSSGGTLSTLLEDLIQCGFIAENINFGKPLQQRKLRYYVRDQYLRFYYSFIKPIKTKVEFGEYTSSPTRAINEERYRKWLGFSFERFCIENAYSIAKILNFGAVNFSASSFFQKAEDSSNNRGTQIDLIFERADKVYTVCEIKYQLKPIGLEIIDEFENKLSALPKKKQYSIHKVLISPFGITQKLKDRLYFDQVITIDDLFSTNFVR
jgi:AAA+ ATPase superfamily predicted ATPase